MGDNMKDFASIHREHFFDEGQTKDIRRYIQITAAYLNLFLTGKETVLDVGASDGEMGRHLNCEYSGIDIFPAAENVSKGDIFDVKKRYKMLIFNHTLEHMENTHDVLRKAHDCLYDDGYLFVNVPIGAWAYEIEGHCILFNETILTRVLEQCGFEVVESSKHVFRGDNVELWVMAQKS